WVPLLLDFARPVVLGTREQHASRAIRVLESNQVKDLATGDRSDSNGVSLRLGGPNDPTPVPLRVGRSRLPLISLDARAPVSDQAEQDRARATRKDHTCNHLVPVVATRPVPAARHTDETEGQKNDGQRTEGVKPKARALNLRRGPRCPEKPLAGLELA